MAFLRSSSVRVVSVAMLRVAALLCAALSYPVSLLHAQVFVVGEKTATDDVSTEFHPTRVELPAKPINELGRRTLIRDLEAEQGFAHRTLPLASEVTLIANGNLTPGGGEYKELLYKKGESAQPGDRVVITTVTFKPDRIVLDINGGPYLTHRFLRHIDIGNMPLVPNYGEQVTGFRVALVFEGLIPDLTAPEVKALLDPLIDFGVKSSKEAYADSMPVFLKQAIEQHDVLVGMNKRMVLAAMGAPESKVRELVEGSQTDHYEEWIYGKVPQTVRFVRIENDRVTKVRIAALGQAIEVHAKNEMQGYLDPLDTKEIALGDRAGSIDEDDAAAHHSAAPTLRKPGDPVAPGSSQRVQYPVPQKEKPLPAAPGSAADPNADTADSDAPQAGGLDRTSNAPSGTIPPIGSDEPLGPRSPVNHVD